MAIHVLPVVAGLGVAGLLAFLVMGSSGAKVPTPDKPPPPPPGKTPAQLGTDDGCAQGTADAKAGLAMMALGDAATKLAAAASASGDAAAYVAAWTAAYADCYSKTPKPITKVMPIKYKVAAGETPASIASKFGVSVDYLMSGLNGYGHGENGVRDNAPYPYNDLYTFVSAFPGMGSGAFPPAGTTFSPTYQAGHKATANLRPIYRSSATGTGGQRYWWFPGGASAGAVPVPYSPNNSGFGRIYSNGGLFLVGPWYTGLELNVPGKPGDTSAGEGDVATSGVVVGALNAAMRAVTGRTLVGAVRMAPRAVRGGLGLASVTAPGIDITSEDWKNGLRLGQEDARRARLQSDKQIGIADWIWRNSLNYTNGYLTGLRAGGCFWTKVGGRWIAVCNQSPYPIDFSAPPHVAPGRGVVQTSGVRRATSHPLGWPAPPR